MNPEKRADRPPQTGRRRWVLAAVGAAATLAGGGLGWRHLLQTSTGGQDSGAQALYTHTFDRPEGGSLDMASLKGRLLLVNFWATWCPPCVEELPLLDGFYREHARKGWQVVGLAIDQPSAVRRFLTRTPISFPVGLAGLGGTELGKTLGNLTGGLPFTVVLGPEGDVLQRKMGKLTAQDLTGWAAAAEPT